MRLSRGRRAPRLVSLLPARSRRASFDFFRTTASLQAPIDLCASSPANRHPAFVNSNLLESRTKHPHLLSIVTLAFAFLGHAGV
jgi:hypothetical protein